MLVGVDWGGTKIEAIAMEHDGRSIARLREETPRSDYEGCLATVASVVKRVEAEEKTKGGIVLPDTAKEKPKEGVVMSLGNGKLLDSGERAKFQVKEKDRVIFSSYAGTEIKIEGQEYLILNEDDVLAVVD